MNANNFELRSIWQRLVAWQDRVDVRIAARNLNDRSLRDIGLTRGREDFPIRVIF
jgi:uncharacterized protein YjiS (DUF1127 family)